jgi:RNA polymerase sigma-70 factor (ECF subfamily)
MVRETEEIHLIRAAQTGDLAAFEEFVRRYELRVYRVALRLLGDPTEAEDATHDALVQAWRALPKFRGECSASTWLYRVVTNRCLNLIQRRRPTEPLSDAQEAPEAEPWRILESSDALDSLKSSIMRLTPEQRVALVLREFEGLTYDEIAAVLDVSLPAVKSRIRRARLDLVGMLRDRP